MISFGGKTVKSGKKLSKNIIYDHGPSNSLTKLNLL
jgi:hypothetical protein